MLGIYLKNKGRRKINERQTNSNGNSGTQFNNKGYLTEDQTVPAKTVQLSGRNNLAKYKVLCFIYGQFGEKE